MASESLYQSDRDVADVLDGATPDELDALRDLLRTKWSSSLPSDCREPQRIGGDFLEMGGNSVANVIRWRGSRYRGVLERTCECIGAHFVNDATPGENEWEFLRHIVKSAEMNLSGRKKKEFETAISSVGLGVPRPLAENVDLLRAQELMYLALKCHEHYLPGRSVWGKLNRVAKTTMTLGVSELTGPAYSVLVPGVCIIASSRLRQLADRAADQIGGGP